MTRVARSIESQFAVEAGFGDRASSEGHVARIDLDEPSDYISPAVMPAGRAYEISPLARTHARFGCVCAIVRG
jgi:hypothetical protein